MTIRSIAAATLVLIALSQPAAAGTSLRSLVPDGAAAPEVEPNGIKTATHFQQGAPLACIIDHQTSHDVAVCSVKLGAVPAGKMLAVDQFGCSAQLYDAGASVIAAAGIGRFVSGANQTDFFDFDVPTMAVQDIGPAFAETRHITYVIDAGARPYLFVLVSGTGITNKPTATCTVSGRWVTP